jgi:hypothetical protein
VGNRCWKIGSFRRCLLAVTTARFRPGIGMDSKFTSLLGHLESSGWSLRQTCPRYYIYWRNNALLTETDIPLAIFSELRFQHNANKKGDGLSVRVASPHGTSRAGQPRQPVKLADRPETVAILQRKALKLAVDGDVDSFYCANFFKHLERRIWQAASGLPLTKCQDLYSPNFRQSRWR